MGERGPLPGLLELPRAHDRSKPRRMRIAVTGGRGRMGTALVAAAATSGHDVVSIDVSPAARPG